MDAGHEQAAHITCTSAVATAANAAADTAVCTCERPPSAPPGVMSAFSPAVDRHMSLPADVVTESPPAARPADVGAVLLPNDAAAASPPADASVDSSPVDPAGGPALPDVISPSADVGAASSTSNPLSSFSPRSRSPFATSPPASSLPPASDLTEAGEVSFPPELPVDCRNAGSSLHPASMPQTTSIPVGTSTGGTAADVEANLDTPASASSPPCVSPADELNGALLRGVPVAAAHAAVEQSDARGVDKDAAATEPVDDDAVIMLSQEHSAAANSDDEQGPTPPPPPPSPPPPAGGPALASVPDGVLPSERPPVHELALPPSPPPGSTAHVPDSPEPLHSPQPPSLTPVPPSAPPPPPASLDEQAPAQPLVASSSEDTALTRPVAAVAVRQSSSRAEGWLL